jgi:purine-nucleoside phosphorylase
MVRPAPPPARNRVPVNTMHAPTPHIDAPAGAFADTVLLPGDPLRARFIAEHYLDDAEQVTAVRGMLGYTGYYRGRRISVMGTGMGIPSCCIYATELVRAYGVTRLLRVGTCGAVSPELALGDLVLAMGAATDSATNRARFGGHDYAATASWSLLDAIASTARAQAVPLHIGNVFSSDLFYTADGDLLPTLQRMGILAVEMEAAGLYAVAAEHGVQAAALLAVSDHLAQGTRMGTAERERGMERMVLLGLEAGA